MNQSKPKVDREIRETNFLKVFPSQALPSLMDKTFNFSIAKSHGFVYDLSKTEVFLKLRILRADQSLLTAENTGKVALESNPCASCFKDITIAVDNRVIYNSNQLYPYLADFHMKYLQPVSKSVEDSAKLETSKFNTHPLALENEELVDGVKITTIVGYAAGDPRLFGARADETALSKIIDVSAPLLIGFYNNQRSIIIPDNYDIQFQLKCNEEKFALQSTELSPKFKIQFVELFLQIPKYSVQEKSSKIRRALSRQYCTKIETKTTVVPKNVIQYQYTVAEGLMPSRISLVFLSENAFLGAYHKSSFAYNRCNIIQFQLAIDNLLFPTQPINIISNDNKNVLLNEAYNFLQKNLPSNGVTKANFHRNQFIVSFDVSSARTAGSNIWSSLYQGNAVVNIKFSEPTNENLNMIMFCEYETIFQLDKIESNETFILAPLH
jgi:hypothetical protein